MKSRPLLRLEDKLAAEDLHLRALGGRERRLLLAGALATAIVVHGAAAFLPSPGVEGRAPAPPERPPFASVVRWVPGPAVRPPEPIPAVSPRALPSEEAPPQAGAFTPEDFVVFEALSGHEPVAEPPPPVNAALPHEAETLIGIPVPPPTPSIAGGEAAGPMSAPVLAPGGRVEPAYPPAARAMRLTGFVRLEIEVGEDGAVGGVNVVGASRRGLGFEEAAIAAVKRWRFLPATRAGRPVAATTTVDVEFR